MSADELRAQTAMDLMHACTCYKNLEAVLPTFEGEERARIQAAMDQFKEEIKRLGERMLLFAASGHCTAPAYERPGRQIN